MPDVNIQIGTKGDITGLKQIETGYQNLIMKSKQAFQALQSKSPLQAIADKQKYQIKLDEIDRKTNDLQRKLASAKLDLAQGVGSQLGVQKLESQLKMVNLQRDVLDFQGQDIAAAQAARRRFTGPVMKAGGFVGRNALKIGGAALGLAGAYSLFSNIAGELGGVDERNLAYATALSQTRNRNQGMDYSVVKPIFEVRKALDDLGMTAYMTSKDMVPLLDVAKELGDFTGGRRGTTGGRLAATVNIGKSLGVDPSFITELLTGGLRSGSFQKNGQYLEVTKMMMLNQNMMHRASESLKAMSDVLAGTTHGAQGVGAFGIFNLLDTLNSSKNRAYWGAGGASAALRIDQAFRGGGDESFQYMQTLALNPAFQARNARMAALNTGAPRTATNWQSGAYDQLMADLMKDLGAFATPQDLLKTMRGMGVAGPSAEKYVKSMYSGGMGKMNIERLFDVYSGTYQAGESTGRKFFMQMQMAKSMGVSPTDIGVIGQALKDPQFLKRARGGKLAAGEYAEAFKAWQSGGKEGYEKWFNERTKNQESFISIAQAIRDSVDIIKEIATNYIQPAGEILKEWLPEMAKTIIKHFGTTEQKDELKAKELMSYGMGLDAKVYRDVAQGAYRKKYKSKYQLEFLPDWMKGEQTNLFMNEEIAGINTSQVLGMEASTMTRLNREPNRWEGKKVAGIDPNAGLFGVIAQAIEAGFKQIQLSFPSNSGTTPLD